MVSGGKNERIFDLRVVHRYIASGRLEKAEYSEYLAALPDLAESIKARDEGGDDDGYERPIATEPRRPLGLPIVRRAHDDTDDGDLGDDLDDEDDDDDLDDDDDSDDDDDDSDDDADSDGNDDSDANADAPKEDAAGGDGDNG
ncbi:MAG TPA: hypothetical protein VG755_08710 [Nannocystaceae bacterium]|nr:hypothetical protein [Nannocystaceae bacterium]